MHTVVLPFVSDPIPLPSDREDKDILAWGEGLENGKVQKGEAEIDSEKGTFYGEWQYTAGNVLVPSGRGVLLNTTHFRMGYVKDG